MDWASAGLVGLKWGWLSPPRGYWKCLQVDSYSLGEGACYWHLSQQRPGGLFNILRWMRQSLATKNYLSPFAIRAKVEKLWVESLFPVDKWLPLWSHLLINYGSKTVSLYPLSTNAYLAIETSGFRIMGKKLEVGYMSECLCFFLCKANLSSTLRTLPCSWEGLGGAEFLCFPLPINRKWTPGSFRTGREEERSPMLEKVEGAHRGSGRRGERAITKTNYVEQFTFYLQGCQNAWLSAEYSALEYRALPFIFLHMRYSFLSMCFQRYKKCEKVIQTNMFKDEDAEQW